jgi:uncharacterized protein DUF4440
MNKPGKIVAIFTALWLCSGTAFPQGQLAPPRPQKRIITKTRLVAIFFDLENELLQALQNKQQTTLDVRLAEDFQLWTPSPPGDPVPRGDWQKQALAENLKAFSLRQMAARSVNENVTVVSFVLSKTVEHAGRSSTSDYFVVDLWQKADEKWKLSDRYASPVAAAAHKATAVQPTGKN